MGRRSRKRTATAAPAPRPHPAPGTAAHPGAPPRRRRGEPPPAPWGNFPLAEICVVIALVLGITGLLVWGPTGRLMMASAAAVGSLAGLEVSLREHLAGHRSHTLVLAGLPAVIALALAFFAGARQAPMLAVGGAVFVAGFVLLRRLFQHRSGGQGWR